MCTKTNSKSDPSGEHEPWLIRHLKRWQPLYQIAVVLSVLVAIIIGGSSINQTARSLTLTQKSIDLQEKEFKIRNRPLLVHMNPEFATNSVDTKGVPWKHSVKIELHNVSDIPAQKVHTKGTVFLDGKYQRETHVTQTACTKISPREIGVDLKDGFFEMATNVNHSFKVSFVTTYSGMLGETSGIYSTVVDVIYHPLTKRLIQIDIGLW